MISPQVRLLTVLTSPSPVSPIIWTSLKTQDSSAWKEKVNISSIPSIQRYWKICCIGLLNSTNKRNMKTNLWKELLIIGISALPFIYLKFIYPQLPDQVPSHWNLYGEADRWTNKTYLMYLSIGFPLFAYLIFWIIPKIDPKGKISLMGNKYQQLRTLMTILISAVCLIIIHSSLGKNEIFGGSAIALVFGLFFIALGNYFKTIRPNYFIGIRTPWTLENDQVWKETHERSGKVWMVGGFLVVLAGIFLNPEHSFMVMMIIVISMALYSVIYSYLRYKKLKEEHNSH